MAFADRMAVLDFLKLRAPPLVVHEVTSTNRAKLDLQYRQSFMVGNVIWEIAGTAPKALGVLRSTSDNQPHQPLIIELMDRHPGQTPEWRSLWSGQAVVDDINVVWLRTAANDLKTILDVKS
jgi:hypothetical protein